jgi:pimeloyl-ACP methyl ester carboxylesterase
LLFVGYPSQKDNITGTADRLREELTNFYPRLSDSFLSVAGVGVREPADLPYEELILLGHSLGGVVVRRALSDAASQWLADMAEDPTSPRPSLLDATVRLFSPASAGFRPGGRLAALRAGPIWPIINMRLRCATAYTDLQPSSPILSETRKRTESALSSQSRRDLKALRPDLLWANPDEVVLTERYDTDRSSSSVDGTSHSSVCKPSDTYEAPWLFVETGKWR